MSSTPIKREYNENIPFFESYLSPITTSTKYEHHILSTSLLFDEHHDINMKNAEQNSDYHDRGQIISLQNTSDISGFYTLNTSQQTFNTEQVIDVTNTKKLNNKQSQEYIIGMEPKYILTENSISQLDIDYESMDIKSQNDEEENKFVENSSKVSTRSDYNEKTEFNQPNESSFTFSEDSVFTPYLKNNSYQLDFTNHDFINGTQDSYNSSNYENKSINHKSSWV